MGNKGEYRSAAARHIVHGGHSEAAEHFPLPPPQTVMVGPEMGGLRQALQQLNPENRAMLEEAFREAEEECRKPSPDKALMARLICRVIKEAKAAPDYREHAGKILPRIAAISSWLGTYGPPLLKEAGISA